MEAEEPILQCYEKVPDRSEEKREAEEEAALLHSFCLFILFFTCCVAQKVDAGSCRQSRRKIQACHRYKHNYTDTATTADTDTDTNTQIQIQLQAWSRCPACACAENLFARACFMRCVSIRNYSNKKIVDVAFLPSLSFIFFSLFFARFAFEIKTRLFFRRAYERIIWFRS